MADFFNINSSESLYNQLDQLYELDKKNLEFLINSVCNENDQKICLKWLKIFEKTAVNEKRQRNFLVLLMVEQINDHKSISLPFTDLKNCDKNLINVVENILIAQPKTFVKLPKKFKNTSQNSISRAKKLRSIYDVENDADEGYEDSSTSLVTNGSDVPSSERPSQIFPELFTINLPNGSTAPEANEEKDPGIPKKSSSSSSIEFINGNILNHLKDMMKTSENLEESFGNFVYKQLGIDLGNLSSISNEFKDKTFPKIQSKKFIKDHSTKDRKVEEKSVLFETIKENIKNYNKTLSEKSKEIKANLNKLREENDKLEKEFDEMKKSEDLPFTNEAKSPLDMQEDFIKLIRNSISNYLDVAIETDKNCDKYLLLNNFQNIFGNLVQHNESLKETLNSCDRSFVRILKSRYEQKYANFRTHLIERNDVLFAEYKDNLDNKMKAEVVFSDWYRSIKLKFIELKCFALLRKIFTKIFPSKSSNFQNDLELIEKKYQDILEELKTIISKNPSNANDHLLE